MLQWAEEHPNFDTSFVVSLDDFLAENEYLTDKQEASLDRIIESFHIDV